MSAAVLKSERTGQEMLTGSCVWKIENFFQKWQVLESPVTSIGSKSEITFKLAVNKAKVNGVVRYSIDMVIIRKTMSLPAVSLRHELFLLDTEGKEIYSWIQQENKAILTQYKTMPIAMLSEDLITGAAPVRDKFTIIYSISLHNINSKSEIPVGTMSRDFQTLFESQKESDVKFLVDSQEFTAHKVVVSTRSPVLSAMFDTAMKERHENQVKIDDIDAETFKELLRFMYTDQVENLREHAYELFKIAHRYELPGLQRMCEDQLYKNLDVENCTVIFSTADTYDCKQLKQRALDFMTENAADVRKTEGCEVLAKSYPHLILEAYHALAANSKKQ